MVRFEDWARVNLSGKATEREQQVWMGAAQSMHATCLDAIAAIPVSDASDRADDSDLAYEEAVQECIDAVKRVTVAGAPGSDAGEESAARPVLEVPVEQLRRWSRLLSEGNTTVARQEIQERLRWVDQTSDDADVPLVH